jgi:hypothetical protein
MMPAQIMSAAVTMCTNARSESLHFDNEFLASHGEQIIVHGYFLD